MYQWMHNRNELEFLVKMLKTNISDAENTEKKGQVNRKHCSNNVDSPNLVSRNEAAGCGCGGREK